MVSSGDPFDYQYIQDSVGVQNKRSPCLNESDVFIISTRYNCFNQSNIFLDIPLKPSSPCWTAKMPTCIKCCFVIAGEKLQPCMTLFLAWINQRALQTLQLWILSFYEALHIKWLHRGNLKRGAYSNFLDPAVRVALRENVGSNDKCIN